MLHRLLFGLVLLGGGVGIYGLQELVDSRTDRRPSVRLRYLLATGNVQRASFGYPQVTADLIWVKAIQFYHQQFVRRLEGETSDESTDLIWLDQVAGLVTDLNPRFVRAYYFFSIYQGAQDQARRDHLLLEGEKSPRLTLLREGFQRNRHTYLLGDHLAHTYFLFHKRVQDAMELGAVDPVL